MQQIKHRKSTTTKYLPVFFFAVIISLVLSACGGTNDPTKQPLKTTRTLVPTKKTTSSASSRPTRTPTSTPEPVSTLGVDPNDLNGIEVEFWHSWSGVPGEAIDELIKVFNETNEWNIIVKASYQGDYDQTYEHLYLALQNDTIPDLVVSYNYQALSLEAPEDVFVDLDAYNNDPIWGFSDEDLSDFFSVFWKQNVVDKQLIGIPAQQSGQLLYYNSTWAEELGFSSPPTTPVQFKRQACAATRDNQEDDDPSNDSTGGWIISTDYSAMLGWFYAFGGEITRPDGKGYQFNSQEVKDTLTFLRDMYDDGCAWLSDSQLPESEFANRQGLFATGSVAGIPYQEAAFSNAESSDEWTVIPFPSSDGEAAIDVYGPSFQMLNSEAENQLASWLLIKWLTSPKNQAELSQATGFYPDRATSLEHLDILPSTYPQWAEAVDLLSVARSEPPLPSWRIVRWAVSDAATQLYRYYFTIEQVPSLVRLLDKTANDLHNPDQ